MRLFRTAQFAAAPPRRTAVALRPPSANSNQITEPRHVVPHIFVCKRAAARRYLRRLAHKARPPQPPKINLAGNPTSANSKLQPESKPRHATEPKSENQHRKQMVAVRQNCAGRSLCPAEARNSHSLVRGLRRLPPAPIDEPFDQKEYPTPIRASDTLIIIYRGTTRGTTAEYPPPRPNRSRPPHWDPWRASAGSSKDWRPGPPSAIRAQP